MTGEALEDQVLAWAARHPDRVRLYEEGSSRRRFVDRVLEQRALEEAWTSHRAELVIMHGRRRVGKTALLRRFAEGKHVAYYAAAQQLEAAQLADLGRALGPLSTGFRPGRPPRLAFSGWEELLDTAADAASIGRIGVVLDEFPYLVEATPSLPSLIQRWWDRIGAGANLMLVLAGSEQEMMRKLVDRDGALHGRPTRRLGIRSLDYYHAGRFVARWSHEDRIRTFAIAGGIPAYLERFDDRHPLRYELYHLAFASDGRLFQEAPELLAREFNEPRTYESILRAMADGYVTPNEIAQQIGLGAANRVSPYLDRLIELGLVERRTLPSEASQVRPRISRYVIADHYLRFYFALLDPWRSAIQQGRGRTVLDHLWAEQFDWFVSRTFEDVACQYLARLSGDGRLPPTSTVGPWWFAGGDIDAAAMSRRQLVAAGEAKWTRDYLKPADEAELRRNVAKVAPDQNPELFLFSRSGFDRNLRTSSTAHLVKLADLYAGGLEFERSP